MQNTDANMTPSGWDLKRGDAIFPQPFTAFEFYFLADERPGYPAVFPIRLEWSGPLNRVALRQAYEQAHARHPFLSARIEYDRKDWPQWIAGAPSPIGWNDATNASTDEPFSIYTSGAVGLFVSEDRGRTVMDFVFHHAAVDGLGAFQFLKDLLLAYAHAETEVGDPPGWPRLEPERLRRRDSHQLTLRTIRPIDVVRVVRACVPLLVRRPAVVAVKGENPSDAMLEGPLPHFLVQQLSTDETTALAAVASGQSIMLNELLLRDLFLALGRWNEGSDESRRPIRVLVPTNLRTRKDFRMPAANVFSYVFLTRTARSLADSEQLLASITREMATVKRLRWGRYFEAGLKLACRRPKILRWSLRREWPFATAVFSNLGTSFDQMPLPRSGGAPRCGNLDFESGAGAPTIRPDTRVAFAVHTYAGRLSVSARCDPRLFGAAEQSALLTTYTDQLRATIESESQAQI